MEMSRSWSSLFLLFPGAQYFSLTIWQIPLCIMTRPIMLVSQYPTTKAGPKYGREKILISDAKPYARGILTKASFHQDKGDRI